MKHDPWVEIAKKGGFSLSPQQLETLMRYQDWLREEAIKAGGLGPAEGDRLESRHVGDSLLFAVAMPHTPSELWDLGSGVGLPGIPLAVLLPETRLTLVERSGRRADLLRRAARVLDLSNIEVRQVDIRQLEGPLGGLVTRATLGPAKIAPLARELLEPGGFALMGGSWDRPPKYRDWETKEIPVGPLDHPVWILIMRRQ